MMLTSNLWVEVGLVNGAMGTVKAICYRVGQAPPHLPIAVMVQFDCCSAPTTLPDQTIPICPIRMTWLHCGVNCSRLQLPLKLAWAITIHKAQGLSLDKAVVNIGRKEFSPGLTFVACSTWQICCLMHLLITSVSQICLVPDGSWNGCRKITGSNSCSPLHTFLLVPHHPTCNSLR